MTDKTRTFRINARAALLLDEACKEAGEPRPAMVLASLLREALAFVEQPSPVTLTEATGRPRLTLN